MASTRTEDGTTIAYRTFGDGPRDVLFMHGWGGAGSGHAWERVLAHMDLEGLRAIVVDLRGHGQSGAATSGFTIERFGRDMFAVADDVGAKRLVVVAFSMSARWAQWMACAEPARVIGQVLVAPAPASDLPLPDEMLDQWIEAARTREGWEPLLRQWTKDALPAEVVDDYYADVAGTPERTLSATFDMCRTGGFLDKVGAISAPTLVITGAHDALLPPDLIRAQIAGLIRGSRMVLLDCGHEIPFEQPRATATLIEAFLAGLEQNRANP